MEESFKIIEQALNEGRSTLSEVESKKILSRYGIPVARERLCHDLAGLQTASLEIGYPLVLKGVSPGLAHKTEKDLIRLDIRTESEAVEAFTALLERIEGIEKAVLVQEMVQGKRELLAGMTRDPQFGPSVLFGLGGIFAELLEDVSFRIAPFDTRQAMEMMQETKAWKLLDGIRGMEPVDTDLLVRILLALGRIGLEQERVKEIDINPLIISGTRPIAVDALFVLE